MAAERPKRLGVWWVWYLGGDSDDLVTFDNEAVAKAYQSPLQTYYLGDKVMIRFVFDPLAKGGMARLFTYDGPWVYDGPETQEQFLVRQHAAAARARIKKQLGTAKEDEKLLKVKAEFALDDDTFELYVAEERELKDARRRKK
jgi:hypothetical protein